jgi:Mrp family chromosome partitioning ATPase
LSCGRGEGVSTVAANLAISATWDEGSTLLLDAQVNSPDIPAAFGVPAAPGWIDAALKGNAPQDFVRPSARIQNLYLAACGGRRRARTVLPVRELMGVIELVRPDFGRIIVDLPSWAECGTALTTASGLDGVVVVVEAERVPRHLVEHVVRQLVAAGTAVVGIVFNKCDRSSSNSLEIQL